MKQDASPHVMGIFVQAVGHHQAGRLDEAVACYHRVLMLQPDLTPAHNNLGNALCEQGKLAEAETIYRRALALQPDLSSAHNNLGTVLFEREKLNEAAASYRNALALQPDYAEAFNNLGAALYGLGKLEEAEANARRAFSLAPDFAQALINLGAILKAQGQFEESGAVYRRLTVIRPRDCEGLNGLAEILAIQGDAATALETVLQSLHIGDTLDAKRIFAEIVKPLRWSGDNRQVREVMLRAIAETWARPSELCRSAAGLIKHGAETGACISRAAKEWPRALTVLELFGPRGASALARDELFCAMLVSTQNTDVEIERFLTMARRLLLDGGGRQRHR